MIPHENYDMHYQDDSAYHIGEKSSHPQTMGQNGQDTGLHCSEERSADHQPTELDHDDADRRTLDESQAEEVGDE
jgi:hypothetical protein